MLHLAAIALALAQASAPTAPTEPSAALAACASIAGPVERLACYDKLAKPSTKEEAPAQATGEWDVSVSTDPLSDAQTVAMSLIEEGRRAALAIRCKQGSKPEVFISWAGYLGSDGGIVTARIGDTKAETKRWSLSTDSKGTFYPGDDVDFLKMLVASPKFVAQTTPYHANPITAVFPLSGLPAAIEPHRALCQLN